jgi:photosystem II stability/assembly factor-like uncharacterized protein
MKASRRIGSIGVALALAGAVQAAAGPDAWTPIGPDGGMITTLAAVPGDGRTLYAGARAGLYKTSDGGASWTSAGPRLDGEDIAAVAAGPDGTVLVSDVTQSYFGRIWRSIDGGASWQDQLLYDQVQQLAFDPLDPARVYAAGPALYVSTDSGATWGAGQYRDFTVVAASPLQSGLVIGGGPRGLDRSTDHGATWQRLSRCDLRAVVFDPVSPQRVYAACGIDSNTGQPQDHLQVSVDGGATWTPAVDGLEGQTVDALAALPGVQGTVYAGTEGSVIFRTTDAGAHWTAVARGIARTRVGVLAFAAGGRPSLFAGTGTAADYYGDGQGVFRSDDLGASWVAASQGLHATSPLSLAAEPAGEGRIYAYTGRDLLRTRDGGASWLPAAKGLPHLERLGPIVAAGTPGRLYATTYLNEIFSSRNGGRTWSARPAPPGTTTVKLVFNALAVDPRDSAHVLFGYGNGVYQSHDGAFSWDDRARLPLGGRSHTVTAAAFAVSSPSTVYAMGFGGRSVHKSLDGGTSWRALSALAPESAPGFYLALAVDPSDAGVVYVAGDQNYYPNLPLPQKSGDGGATWAPLSFNHEGHVTALATGRGLPGFVAAVIVTSQTTTVVLSQDHGATWTDVGTVPSALYPTTLLFDPASTPARWTLYMATYNDGILSLTHTQPPS